MYVSVSSNFSCWVCPANTGGVCEIGVISGFSILAGGGGTGAATGTTVTSGGAAFGGALEVGWRIGAVALAAAVEEAVPFGAAFGNGWDGW